MNKLKLLSQKIEVSETSVAAHQKIFKELLHYRHEHLDEFQNFNPEAAVVLSKLQKAKQVRTKLLEHFISSQLRYKYIKSQLLSDNFNAFNTDTLLHQFLATYFNKNLKFELFFREVRKNILNKFIDNKTSITPSISLMAALGMQSFNNEYIWFATPTEVESIEELKKDIEANKFTEIDILIYAMYHPLHTLTNANSIVEQSTLFTTQLSQDLRTRLLKEPLEEEAIKPTIPPIGNISNEISLAVREQYEESPYPRWTFIPSKNRLPFQKMMEHKKPAITWPAHFQNEKKQILIAGCGTGRQPIITARANPNADVLAIDLSKSSIAYAKRMANQLKVPNLSFIHGDILDLPTLNRKFHFVASSGVIHHMQDQQQAWQTLDTMLLDGGILHIGVYSKIARMQVSLFRNKIAEAAIGSSPAEIIKYRENLINDPNQKELLSKFQMVPDLFSTSMLRDFMFHASEYQYRIDELIDFMNQFKLQFICFSASDHVEKKYKATFPDDPNLRSLSNWNKFEKFYAGTYNMLNFWAQKQMGV